VVLVIEIAELGDLAPLEPADLRDDLAQTRLVGGVDITTPALLLDLAQGGLVDLDGHALERDAAVGRRTGKRATPV
jgi:hypothetical protein